MAGVYVKRSLTSSTRALMGHTITVMAVIKRRKRRKRFFPLRERTVPSNRIYFTVDVRFVERGKRKTNIDAYNFLHASRVIFVAREV